MEGKLRIGYILARPVGASRLKRLRLSFLDPMDVVDVDKDLIGRAREAVAEFFISISHKLVAIVDLVKGHSEKQGGTSLSRR